MLNCIHCEAPNPEEWFYCRECGKRASDIKFTTNLYMMSEIGKRTDIEFRDITVEQDIKDMNRRRYASGR